MNDEYSTFASQNISRRSLLKGGAGLAGMATFSQSLESHAAPDAIKLRFAYEGPKGTAQELAANLFQKTLENNSNGKMSITQYPGALYCEPYLSMGFS